MNCSHLFNFAAVVEVKHFYLRWWQFILRKTGNYVQGYRHYYNHAEQRKKGTWST